MGGSDTTQTTQSQSVQQLPPWINQAAQQNYAFAQNVAQQPLQQYQGQMVADVSPQTQQSWNTAATGGAAGQDQYNAAQAGLLGVMGQQPQQVQAGQLSNSTNLQPYENPYTNSVINATLPIMQQQNALNQNQQANAANSANAFGGSRQGVQQGVAQAQGGAKHRPDGGPTEPGQFWPGPASGAVRHHRPKQCSPRQPGGAAEPGQPQFTGGERAGRAWQPGAAFASAQFHRADDRRPDGAGTGAEPDQCPDGEIPEREQLPEPATFDHAERARHDALRAGAAGLVDHPDADRRQPSADGARRPNDARLAVLRACGRNERHERAPEPLRRRLSDRRLKTDITKVGSKMGVPIHAYRYKGDPKSYPKVVGPMAEDVAKTFGPGSVAKIPGSGGKMAVHPAVMGALGAPLGPAMAPPVPAGAMGGPRMPGPNLAAIAGARPPMGAMAPPVAAGAMGGPAMPGPNLAAIAAGGQGPLAAPKMIRPRRMRVAVAQPRGALSV